MRFDQLQRVWEELGEKDPLWAVLTDDSRKGNRWDAVEFFARGRSFVDEIEGRMAHYGLELRGRNALDFGCGVGRITLPLATRFEEVVGVDISGPMITKAIELNQDPRVSFRLNQTNDLTQFPDACFSYIQTFIVLQHMHPSHQVGYLREFGRVLEPGGVLAFQTPTYRNGPLGADDMDDFVPVAQVKQTLEAMRMFPIAPPQVLSILDEAGIECVGMERDTMTGGDLGSATYFCLKRQDTGPLYRASDGFLAATAAIVDRTQKDLVGDPRYADLDLWTALPPGHRAEQLQKSLTDLRMKHEDLVNSKAYRLGRRVADFAYRLGLLRSGNANADQ